MNKFLQKLAKIFLGLSMAAGVGVAFAAGKTGATPVHADNYTLNSMSGSYSTSGGTVTISGVTWTYSSAKYLALNSGKVQAGSQNNPCTSGWTFQTPISSFGSNKKITAVSLTAYSGRSGASYDIVVGDSSVKHGSLTTSSATYSQGSLSVTSGNIIFTLTASSSSRALYLCGLSVTYEESGGGDSVTLSVNPTSLELEVGDTDTFAVSISSTGTYGTEFIVESGEESVATVSPDVGDGDDTITVTAEGAGTTTITVSSIDGNQTATVNVSVTQPFVSKNYVLCTSTSDLVANSSYLITNGTSGSVLTMASSVKGNNRDTVNASVVNGKIASTNSMLSVKLGGSEGAWTFATENYAGTAGYLNATSTTSDNYLQVKQNLDNYAYFSVTFSDSAAVITCTGKSSRNVIRNNNALISCYTSGYNPVYLWKESDGTSLTIDVVKHLDYVGHDFGLEATADGYQPSSWTWSSNPAGVVNISNSSGVATVTPIGAGTTTITVSAPNGATAKTATCAVTITSQSGADTSHPLSIDDALLIAHYTGTTVTSSSYYLDGVVSSLSSNHPILQGTSETLTVYKDCSGTVYAGDTIRVHGPILNYNGNTPEFNSSSTVTVINIPVGTITVANPTPIPTSIDDGDLSDYLTVTINGTNDRVATNQAWTVTNSSNTSVISLSGADGKTFDSGSTVGSTTLTVASVGDSSKTATISVTTLDSSIPVLQSVTVSGTPTKATQYVGQNFSWQGLTFTPVYNPVKDPVESIDGDDIVWNTLVAGQNPTGTYTGDDSVSVLVTVTSVSVEADGVYSVHVSGDMSTKTYDEEASWNYTGLVVKVTYKSDHETQVTPTSAISWSASSTPKQLGVGSGKSVNVTAAVDGVSSSAYEVSGITINEHQADKYGEYTGAITAGQYVIYASDGALTASVSNNRFTNTAVTISSGVITDPSASIVWTIEQIPNTNYWSIYNSGTSKYAGGTSSKNQGALLSSIEDLAKWTITYDNGYVFQNYGRTQALSDSANAYLRQNGSSGWGTYAASYGSAPTLYKLNYLPKAWASFNYVDATPNKTSYMVGEPFDPEGLEIHAVYTEPSIYPEENITDKIVWDALTEGTTATGTWDGHTVTITGLTISSFTPTLFTKATSLDQIAVGSEVIIGAYKDTNPIGWNVLCDIPAGKDFFDTASTTVDGDDLFTTSDCLIFTVEADTHGYYLKNNNRYLNRSGNNNAMGEKDTSNERLSCWTFAFTDGQFTMKQGTQNFQFNKSSPRFKCYTSSQTAINIYVRSTASETDILKTYASRYLLLENETLAQIPSGETGNAGTDCLGLTGPYMTAKSALNSGEFASHKSNFQSSSDSIVANARLRYEAWARAYGDTTPYATTVGNGSRLLQAVLGENTNTVAIIVIISMVSVTAIGGYFFLRKRKENI